MASQCSSLYSSLSDLLIHCLSLDLCCDLLMAYMLLRRLRYTNVLESFRNFLAPRRMVFYLSFKIGFVASNVLSLVLFIVPPHCRNLIRNSEFCFLLGLILQYNRK